MADEKERASSDSQIEAPRENTWIRFIGYAKRKSEERAAKKKNETPADKAARRTAVATVWMAIFTCILAATSGLTIWVLKNQLREMHEGGIDTHALANAAGDQADAAQQFSDTAEDINERMSDAVEQLQATADNAKSSLNATKEAMRLDQRAWVGTSDYTYTLPESGDITSSAAVLNTGKTPAMNIVCKITGTTKPKGHTLVNSDISYPPTLVAIKAGALFPNQHFPLNAGSPTPMDPDKQKIWFGNIQNGTWVQFFFGEVRYEDAFGRKHWTHFCTKFVPSTKAGTPCPIYNETDDTKEQKQNPN